jgi:hypothetical protein
VVELFGTGQERVEVLNWSAPYFFELVHDIFFEATLLRICRLTDPAKQGKKDNVSINLLPPIIDQKIAGIVKDRIAEIKLESVFARDWRNRHIAHHDFALTFDEAAEPLARVTRKMVDSTIGKLNTLLNVVEEHYTGANIAFEHFIARGQADDLVQVLYDIFEDDQQFTERSKTNTLTKEDLHRAPKRRI